MLVGPLKSRAYALGNFAGLEGLDVQRGFEAHKASSDVTVFSTHAANRGRGLPTEVMLGAWLVGQVFQTEDSGRVP